MSFTTFLTGFLGIYAIGAILISIASAALLYFTGKVCYKLLKKIYNKLKTLPPADSADRDMFNDYDQLTDDMLTSPVYASICPANIHHH